MEKIKVIWNLCDNILYKNRFYWGYQFTHREVRWVLIQTFENKVSVWFLMKQYWVGPNRGWSEDYTNDAWLEDFEKAKNFAFEQIIIPDKYNHDENYEYSYEFEQ